MTKLHQMLFFLLLCLHAVTVFCEEAAEGRTSDDRAVYIVTLKEAPVSHYGEDRRGTRTVEQHQDFIHQLHDSILTDALGEEEYEKLYSYHYLINGFTVLITHKQAEKLSSKKEVANVVLDSVVKIATTYTPQFLGLPHGAWPNLGGRSAAGEGVVIGFIDTGIDPTHPSFADNGFPYPTPDRYSGICEVTRDFPAGSCNRKLIGARHFAASATTRGILNVTQDNASPFDGDGHGTHTASVAAGNYGIPVTVAGQFFGNASGMAPRAQIAVYKALYKHFGGFVADIVAAIDQAAQDGVDIINLSITPNNRPPGIATFFNPLDMALLSAVKAGIFVVQAAGNAGPSPKSMSSFSPWICTVGATSHDRVYSNFVTLGNKMLVHGVGLAPGTKKGVFTLISAIDAVNETSGAVDIYVDECQDPCSFNRPMVKDRLLICKYSVRYVLGLSTVKRALETASNLSAAGVIFSIDPLMYGFKINPTPMAVPSIMVSSPDDSKLLLQYYNSSLERKRSSGKIVKFGAVASISGLTTNYSLTAPSVMYYSARGPDPEDNFLGVADILKPNLVAPGNMIWGAWSALATGSVEFQGESLAMLSGTSMATPHISGLAALIKQKFPTFSPSAITSALATTAMSTRYGGAIMAQRFSSLQDDRKTPATPFDMGSGLVNATAALDPGLIFDASFEDFMSFLCGFNGSASLVYNHTGESCIMYSSTIKAADLNLPSITIAKLEQQRTVHRTLTNVAGNETYTVSLTAPDDVSVEVSPNQFAIVSEAKQVLTVTLTATRNSSIASFGSIQLTGSHGHTLNIPLSVIYKTYQT